MFGLCVPRRRPAEVERLQTQLTRGELESGEFFGLILSMYELETGKQCLRTVIQNVRT